MSPEVRTGMLIMCVMQFFPFLAGIVCGAWVGKGEPVRIAKGLYNWMLSRMDK